MTLRLPGPRRARSSSRTSAFGTARAFLRSSRASALLLVPARRLASSAGRERASHHFSRRCSGSSSSLADPSSSVGHRASAFVSSLAPLTRTLLSSDGRDISTIGLDSLRKSLAVIPQGASRKRLATHPQRGLLILCLPSTDALLYAGTVRENLDPTGEKDDATLNDALRRAGLVASESASEDVKTRFSKFKLDASVTDDGGNFSAGGEQPSHSQDLSSLRD